jgi:hypothetical protein
MRLRLQAFLEWACIALIPAIGQALVVLWLHRMDKLTTGAAIGIWAGLGAAVLIVGAIGALRRIPTKIVATRLDRASGLSDRLATALEFDEKLRAPKVAEHPETLALMQKAIEDGVKAVPRAKVAAASPFRAPETLYGAGAMALIALLVWVLHFEPEVNVHKMDLFVADDTGLDGDPDLLAEDEKTIDPDELEMPREFLKDMKQMADQSQDRHLQEFANELEKLLEMAEKGELSKEELMAKMDALEKSYMEGADQDVEAMLEELKQMSKELKKEKETQALAEALDKGDLEEAAKEMEKLAEKMEKGEMSPEQQKKVAEAMEKAAEQMEKKRQEKEKKDDAQASKDQKKKEDEIRKLQKKAEQDPKNEDTKRQLQKKERELEELKREKEQKKEAQRKRSLERLSRNMKKSAESLKNKNQDKQEQAKNMKDVADETRKVNDDVRKINNQKKVQSQLGDLKEAIRRAKPKKGGGKGKGFAQRMQDFKKRAGGGQGNPNAWKQQGQGGKGNGKDDPNGKPGDGIGDSSDPNLMGDATDLAAKKKDEDVNGVHGKGPSRRETIITAAKKGFATTSYKKVYADYRKLVEEVMSTEKVPQGYKYYVKRYFQGIKPHKMD